MDFQPYLDIPSDEMLFLYHCGTPVRDACEDISSMDRRAHVLMLSDISDYRGYPKMFRLGQAPAKKGACYRCAQKGVWVGMKRKRQDADTGAAAATEADGEEEDAAEEEGGMTKKRRGGKSIYPGETSLSLIAPKPIAVQLVHDCSLSLGL